MKRMLAEIAPCFVEMDGRRTDIVVLACTHYPFLANRLPPAGAMAGRLAGSGRGDRPARAVAGVKLPRRRRNSTARTSPSSPPAGPTSPPAG